MKNTIPILILIFFTSCDPGVINKFVVENKTESEIIIESKLKSGRRNIGEKDSIKSVEIKPQSEAVIINYGEIGNAHDKGINFLEGIDTIIIKKKNGVLDINLFDRKNWTFKVIKRRLFSLDEVEYRLTLTDNDF